MLRYTGHPIADIGVATIAAFCGKIDLASLTEKDLAKTAKFLWRVKPPSALCHSEGM